MEPRVNKEHPQIWSHIPRPSIWVCYHGAQFKRSDWTRRPSIWRCYHGAQGKQVQSFTLECLTRKSLGLGLLYFQCWLLWVQTEESPLGRLRSRANQAAIYTTTCTLVSSGWLFVYSYWKDHLTLNEPNYQNTNLCVSQKIVILMNIIIHF